MSQFGKPTTSTLCLHSNRFYLMSHSLPEAKNNTPPTNEPQVQQRASVQLNIYSTHYLWLKSKRNPSKWIKKDLPRRRHLVHISQFTHTGVREEQVWVSTQQHKSVVLSIGDMEWNPTQHFPDEIHGKWSCCQLWVTHIHLLWRSGCPSVMVSTSVSGMWAALFVSVAKSSINYTMRSD